MLGATLTFLAQFTAASKSAQPGPFPDPSTMNWVAVSFVRKRPTRRLVAVPETIGLPSSYPKTARRFVATPRVAILMADAAADQPQLKFPGAVVTATTPVRPAAIGCVAL